MAKYTDAQWEERMKNAVLPKLKRQLGNERFYAAADAGVLKSAMEQARAQGLKYYEVGAIAQNMLGAQRASTRSGAFAAKQAARQERFAQHDLLNRQERVNRLAMRANERRLAQATGLAKEGVGFARQQMALASQQMQNPYTMGAGVQQQIFESAMNAYQPQYQQYEQAVRANLAGQGGLTSAQRQAALSRAQTQYGDYAGETQRQIGIQAALQRTQDIRNAMSTSQAAQGSFNQAASSYMSLLGNTQYRPAQYITPSTVSGGLSTAEISARIRNRLRGY